MVNRPQKRRYRKASDRRVWVFSDLNRSLTPEHMAKLIVRAGLERARLEAEAKKEREAAQTEAQDD